MDYYYCSSRGRIFVNCHYYSFNFSIKEKEIRIMGEILKNVSSNRNSSIGMRNVLSIRLSEALEAFKKRLRGFLKVLFQI